MGGYSLKQECLAIRVFVMHIKYEVVSDISGITIDVLVIFRHKFILLQTGKVGFWKCGIPATIYTVKPLIWYASNPKT